MTYVEFVEKIRKRQVWQGMGDAPSKPYLADFYRKQDWAIPSYDFGRSLWPSLEMEALQKAADDWVLDGRFRLPFPECVFLHDFPDTQVLVRAMEQPDGSIVLQPYSQAHGSKQIVRISYVIRFGGGDAGAYRPGHERIETRFEIGDPE
jgi:hypothetical protein